jgi:hypothetical protein
MKFGVPEDDLPPRHPDKKHRDATPPIQEGSFLGLAADGKEFGCYLCLSVCICG